MDTVGPISRTLEDAAITLGAIAGYDPKDPFTWQDPVPDYRQALDGNLQGIRIGIVSEDLHHELVKPQVPDAVVKASHLTGRGGPHDCATHHNRWLPAWNSWNNVYGLLEDVNAIRNLKARYAAYCDDNYNPDGIAALFTEDTVWESQGLGRFEGREAIRAFFRDASRIFTFAIHSA